MDRRPDCVCVRAAGVDGGPVRAARAAPLAARPPPALARPLRLLPPPHRLARHHGSRPPGMQYEKDLLIYSSNRML